jgi:hypothetical protein
MIPLDHDESEAILFGSNSLRFVSINYLIVSTIRIRLVKASSFLVLRLEILSLSTNIPVPYISVLFSPYLDTLSYSTYAGY